jgi:hypothetical protein
VHAAHRGAHDEAQASDSEPLKHQPLRLDHVVIIVSREARPEPVARLGRAAVADGVGQDDVIAGDVERLAGTVKLVGELRREELPPRAASAVEHHHRIVDPAVRVAARGAQRRIMDAERRQGLARAEAEIGERDLAFGQARSPIRLLRRSGRGD